MAARIGVLVVLVLALLGGLAWWTVSSEDGGSDGLAGRTPGSRAARPGARAEAQLAPIADAQVASEDRRTVRGGSTRRQAPVGEDGAAPLVEEVVLIVRAADGGPIRKSLSDWGLGRHPLTCVGSRNAPTRYRYRPMPAARAPYRFATILPALVEGDTTFSVVARQRPCFVSLLISGVVVKTERVSEGTSEVVMHVTEEELRAALGGVRLCLVSDPSKAAPRARAYLRRQAEGGGDSIEQFVALAGSEGCFEFQDIPPGEYQLAIYANQYASTFRKVEVVPSRVLELDAVTLEAPASLVGTLTGDERFRANRQVSIQVVDRSGKVPRSTELRRVATDSRGTFRVSDLAPGEYALHVVQPSSRGGPGAGAWPLSRGVVVNTQSGGVARVELPLEDTHQLVVRSVLPRDVDVEFRDMSGVTVLRLSLVARGVRQVGVVPGRYQMIAVSGGREVERTFVETPPTMTAIIGD